MGNILNDIVNIVDDVNIKPNKSKIIIKWIITIASSLIIFAFVFGQFKSSFFNRMDKFEESINKNTAIIEQLKIDMSVEFDAVDTRINKVYSDGFAAFDDYQQFNKKQLILVLDYGQTNKELLKEMLELNIEENTKNVESQMQQAIIPNMMEESEISINIKKIEPEKTKEYLSLTYVVENDDTLFGLFGTTKEFINKINKNKYEIGTIIQNEEYPNLFDVNYQNK